MTLTEALAEFGIRHEAQSEHDFMRAQGGRFLYWRGECLGNYDAKTGWVLVELLRSVRQDTASLTTAFAHANRVAR